MKELISQRDAVRDEMTMLKTLLPKTLVSRRIRKSMPKKYQLAMERYEAAKSKYEDLAAQVAEEHRKQRAVETFINNVRDLGVITEFDETLWGLLVDKVVVYGKNDIRMEFKK